QVYDALISVWSPRGIYEQQRYRPQGTGDEAGRAAAKLVRGELAPVEVEVKEGPLTFVVDVTAPLGTGLFPDLREGRFAVRARARPARLEPVLVHRRVLGARGARGRERGGVGGSRAQSARARAAQSAGQRSVRGWARVHRWRRVQGARQDGRP